MSGSTQARCAVCAKEGLTPLIDFGRVPLADRFVSDESASKPDPLFDLAVASCPNCTLVQLTSTPPPEVLFGDDYVYLSTVSKTVTDNATRFANHITNELGLGPKSQIIEIASNDGYLLHHFKRRGIDVLGIEPAPIPAEVARKQGIKTLQQFFTNTLAKSLSNQQTQADLVVANNVLAHVPDPHDFIKGVRTLLKPKGIAVFEVGYVCDLIANKAFDTIYHEHHFYFSMHTLTQLFSRNKMQVIKVEHLDLQGGSLRVYCSPEKTNQEPIHPSVAKRLKQEVEFGVASGNYLHGFDNDVTNLIGKIKAFIECLKNDGKTIAAYGAAAKGTMLLNATGISTDLIDYVVDRNAFKVGKYIPGVKIPILPPEKLATNPPDYLLVLPWNIADEIATQQSDYLAAGGKLIIPVPTPRIYP